MTLVTEVRTRCRSRRGVTGAIAFALVFVAGTAFAQSAHSRLSRDLAALAAGNAGGTARVIVDVAASDVDALATRYGGRVIRTLKRGAVLELPAAALSQLDADGAAAHVASDTPTARMMATTVVSTGADQVWAGAAGLPYTGAGIGVAVIDSGISNHPELNARIVASVDFLGSNGRAVDEYGHGTHVAGSVHAMAPGANIVNLRVLDKEGSGLTSDAIDAIDWAIAHKAAYNIRIINLSLGHLPVDSYADDPLCQAVERAVAAGIVVVAAAGNYGKTDDGTPVIGAIVSPGTDPFALTVGALNTKGTPQRSDDDVASYSSRGPTIDGFIKPDLVAPGNKIVSLAAPGSGLWRDYPELRVNGPGPGYLTLSGTSMSAAVVSGAAALVLEANPALTPLDVRIALEVTSSFVAERGLIEQGAGSLNLLAAIGATSCKLACDTAVTIAGELARNGQFFVLPAGLSPSALTAVSPLILRWPSAGVSGDVLIWTRNNLSSDVLIWTRDTVAGDVLIWTRNAVTGDVLIWTRESSVFSDVLIWTKRTLVPDVLIWTNTLSAEALIWTKDVLFPDVLIWTKNIAVEQ